MKKRWLVISGALVLVLGVLWWMASGDGSASSSRGSDDSTIVAQAPALAASPTPTPAPVEATPAPAPAPVEIEPVRFTARVLSAADDSPIPSAQIRFHREQEDRFTSPTLVLQADATGAMVLDLTGLVPTHHDLVIAAEGFETVLDRVAPTRKGWESTDRVYRLARGEFLNGRVVDEDGNPVSSARVGVLRATGMPEVVLSDPYRCFPEVETTAAGAFELMGLSATEPVRLVVRKRGFLPHFSDLLPPGTRNHEVVLSEGEAAIEGLVLSAEGTPVKGATVRTFPRPFRPGFVSMEARFPDESLQFTRTDERGFYEFSAIKAGWVVVVADVHLPVRQSAGQSTFVTVGEKRTLNIKFRPPLVINGIVVREGASAEPVAGVRVVPPGVMPDPMTPVTGEVTSGSDGRFTVKAHPIEEFGAWTIAPLQYRLPQEFGADAEEWRAQNLRLSDIEAGNEVRIVVRPSVVVTGVVMDLDAATPAAGVGVDFYAFGEDDFRRRPLPSADPTRSEAVTDAKGRFTLRAPRDSNGVVYARRAKANAWMFYRPTEGDKNPITLTLRSAVSISGTVTDPAGLPMEGVELSFQPMGSEFGGTEARRARMMVAARETLFGAQRTVTDAQGRYTREGVSPDPVLVRPMLPEGSTWIRPDGRTLTALEDTDGIDFQFKAGSVVTGIVVDSSAEPVAGATVTVSPGPSGERRRGLGVAAVETDEKGNFSIAVPEEVLSFNLTASHPNHENAELVDIDPVDQPFTLVLQDRRLIGLTAWRGSSQITDFEYEIARKNAPPPSGRASRARNVITGKAFAQTEPVREAVAAGDHLVQVYPLNADQKRSGEYGFLDVTIPDGTTAVPVEVRVDVGESLTVTGVVVEATEEGERPLPGVTVRLNQVSDPAERNRNAPSSVTDAAGAFSIPFVRPGNVRLSATLAGYSHSEPHEMTVVAGSTPEPVKLVMSATGTVLVKVTGADSDLLKDLTTYLHPNPRSNRDFDSNGVAAFENARAGDRRVWLQMRGGSTIDRQDVKLPVGGTVEAVFNLEGRVMLEGEIYKNGRRLTDRRLELRLLPGPGNSAPEQGLLARDGEFRHLTYPGAWEVSVLDVRTGFTFVVDPTPSQQRQRIDLKLVNLGIVILVPPGERVRGTMRLEYAATPGAATTRRNIPVQSARFFVENVPPGIYTATYTALDGTVYTAPPTDTGEDEESILTLLPPE